MKTTLAFISIILCFMSRAMASDDNYVPENGFVPNEQTAVSIAEAVLMPIYGAEAIKKERPFKASLQNGVWTVVGTLPRGLLGGVATIEISKIDGHVLRVTHEK